MKIGENIRNEPVNIAFISQSVFFLLVLNKKIIETCCLFGTRLYLQNSSYVLVTEVLTALMLGLCFEASCPIIITKEEAKALGWKSKQANLAEVAPGKMLGGNIYQNKEKLLPSKLGRSWYAADLDFDIGFRNNKRLFYSNDGLIFVSYDHGQTFYEIIE